MVLIENVCRLMKCSVGRPIREGHWTKVPQLNSKNGQFKDITLTFKYIVFINIQQYGLKMRQKVTSSALCSK